MRKSGIWKSAVTMGMLIAGMGIMCSCGIRQVPSHMDKVGNGEAATVSTGDKADSEDTESIENEKQDTSSGGEIAPTESAVTITQEDLRRLVDGNIKCNEWFGYSSLPVDASADLSQTGRLVDQSYFADYASFEEYIRSIYCSQEAERLLYNFPEEGTQKYYDQDGMLYLDVNYDGAKGYYVDWSDYTVTIDSVEGNQCTFTATATVEWPADEPVKESYPVTQTAIYENGNWVLTQLFQ